MHLIKILTLTFISVLFTNGYAFETQAEKNETTKNEIKHEAKKAVNRIEETVCLDSDVECLKQKASHRIEETTDAVKDKTTEIKNKIDE
ncbi:MAG: hypothetical protein WC782_02825 [Methylococcaceae bacterium]|jgi:hypothetical protein